MHLAGPWRPHFGIEVTLNARPNSISGPKLIAPKPLPVDDAAAASNTLNDYQKWHTWTNAIRKARTKLRAAKLATGFAILGTLPAELVSNHVVTASLHVAAQEVGEHVAQASLTS